jgi:hypothetical protein
VSEPPKKITKLDLYDWVKLQGCIIEPLPEYKAKVLNIINPKNGSKAFLYLPIDNSPLGYYTVYKVCSDLGVPIPGCADFMKPVHDHIQIVHQLRKKNP